MWGGRVKVIKTRLEGCHSPLARTTVWQRVLVLIYSKVKLSEAMRTYESTSQGFELWCLWSQAFGGIPMVSYIQLIGYLIDPNTTSNIWIFQSEQFVNLQRIVDCANILAGKWWLKFTLTLVSEPQEIHKKFSDFLRKTDTCHGYFQQQIYAY